MMKKILEKLSWKAWGKITMSMIYFWGKITMFMIHFISLGNNMTVMTTLVARERSKRVITRLLAREGSNRTMLCWKH